MSNSRPSATDCNHQPILLPDLGPRRGVADFSGYSLSTDGGALLLRDVNCRPSLTLVGRLLP
jgi:hypothetical protein